MESLATSTGIFRPMLRLALPVLAEESLSLLVGYTDWWLTGHYLKSTDHLAAMGLMAYVMWLIPSLFAAVAIGATALTSRFVGAGKVGLASHVTNQAVVLGSLVAVAGVVVTLLGVRPFVGLLQLTGPAADLAVEYTLIVSLAIPAIMIEQVGAACLRGAGDTVSGFLAKSVVNVVNLVVSSLLVIGPGPIPQLGWTGLAIGTATGYLVGGCILLFLLIRGRAGMRLTRSDLRPDRPLLRRLWRIGLPGGVDVLSVLGCHLVYVSIINSISVSAAAAHGLGVQIEALAYLPCTAFQVAATTLAGQFLGAGDSRRAARAVAVTTSVGVGLLTVAGLLFYFAGHWLTAFFTGHGNPTGLQTAGLLKIVAISTPPLAILMVLTGALRGAGDTRWPLVITFVGLLGVRIPGACLLAWELIPLPFGIELPGAGLGVAGAWWAMTADVILRSLLAVARFLHGGWKQIRV